MNIPTPCTAFDGNRRLASGARLQVALAVKALLAQRPDATVLIFDDDTGSQIDFDLRGSSKEVAARLTGPAFKGDDAGAVRGPGRPKLGVVPREVTLLPRHWDWLAKQPGGASVTLRKLVEEARRAQAGKDAMRKSQERAYRFMAAMAGNLPNFEEATRALFASNGAQFSSLVAEWPADIRDYAAGLAGLSNEVT
ncbi:MAG: DUF2239 family protein [Rhodomicrobium sp.]